MNVFDKLNEFFRNSEYSVVNLASTIAPWLTPLVPAYLSYSHLTGFLDFPVWAAMGTAVAVEILGFATISTGLDFWKHNRSPDGKAKYKKLPLSVPIGAFFLYFMTVLSLNVILELPIPIEYASWVRVISIFFLITLTIPAGALVAVRALHTDILYGKSVVPKVSENFPKVAERTPQFPSDWRQLTRDQKLKVLDMDRAELIQAGLSERTAYNWHQYAEDMFRGNGK